jgi:hypothetical protein
MEIKLENLNKLLVHPSFKATVEEINKIDISLPPVPSQVNLDLQNFIFPPNGELVTPAEEIAFCSLDPRKGQDSISDDRPLVAYDESINKFSALEGTTYITSHSLILVDINDYVPINLITLYFYTRSTHLVNNSPHIKYSTDPDMDSKKDYIKDKIEFLIENVPKRSILLIDGPLIGGDVYTYMIHAINKFLDKDIIPIFFVKNSSSNLIVENTTELKGKFNSDMHWAYKSMKRGQRTNFFKYADKHNIKNAKIFCYLKGFNISPQRVELHVQTYEKYQKIIPEIMDYLYYLLLVGGDKRNPQLRPISIAEKYARETLRLFDFNNLMQKVGITPTMNQDRFAW